MNKLVGKSKLSSLDDDNKKYDKKITSSKSNTNITTGLSPKTFRLTNEEKEKLDNIRVLVQENTNKNINESKIIKGLIWLLDDKPKLAKDLLESINKHI